MMTTRTVRVKLDDRWYTVEVGDLTERPVRTVVDGHVVEVDVSNPIEDVGVPAEHVLSSSTLRPYRPSTPRSGPAPVPSRPATGPPPGAVVDSPPDPQKVFAAPMPGVILSVSVNPGDQVVTGDAVCVLEAMKMQQVLRADWSGIVKSVFVTVGQQVMNGTPIIELE